MGMRKWLTWCLWLSTALFVGCQTYSKVEYYEDGQIKSEEHRTGVRNYSDGKQFHANVSGI